ncbi:hypothetical protein [Bacillus smithii]|jgi:hypothetical protein
MVADFFRLFLGKTLNGIKADFMEKMVISAGVWNEKYGSRKEKAWSLE